MDLTVIIGLRTVTYVVVLMSTTDIKTTQLSTCQMSSRLCGLWFYVKSVCQIERKNF